MGEPCFELPIELESEGVDSSWVFPHLLLEHGDLAIRRDGVPRGRSTARAEVGATFGVTGVSGTPSRRFEPREDRAGRGVVARWRVKGEALDGVSSRRLRMGDGGVGWHPRWVVPVRPQGGGFPGTTEVVARGILMKWLMRSLCGCGPTCRGRGSRRTQTVLFVLLPLFAF